MDRVSENLLNEFASERGLGHLPEDKRFENFVTFITVGRHYSETFRYRGVASRNRYWH
jgi:hypothetical protein